MQQIILVVHLLVTLALIGVILIQRSEGGGLGVGGGAGGMGQFMSVRGTANLLTRMTALLAAAFMGTSITLAILAGGGSTPSAIVEEAPAAEEPAEESSGGVPLSD